MSEVMTCMPFEQLMNWVLEEKKTKGTVFGQHRAYVAETDRKLNIFERNLETPIGPAAGPHTQLTQNIVASYYAGARFFELKTVQKMDGAELAACINRPCILADDEGYNCEWSTELYVPQAMGEYIKAWFILHVIAKEFDLGAQDGFQFNISVGYDLAGIKEPKVNTFIDSMMEAKDTEIFKECKQWLLDNVDKFEKVTKEDIVSVVDILGEERLAYKTMPINVAFIRGTYADTTGNVTLHKEVTPLDATSMAQAVKNSGGIVVVQVEKLVKAGTLDPRLVKVPGIYVDYVVVADPKDHQQTLDCDYDPALSGEMRNPDVAPEPLPLSAKKIIGRRGAVELEKDVAVNLGVGAPEYVASVANEEGIGDFMTLTVEGGAVLGGKLANLEKLADRGVKMMTLTWNGENELASGHKNPEMGFTDFGREVVKEMERQNIIVDVSHLNDKGMEQLMGGIATKPIIATHSNLRSICSHKRNLTEEMFQYIVEHKGLVVLNLLHNFVSDNEMKDSKAELFCHVYRMLELGGEDVIACGSDFDGGIESQMDNPAKFASFGEYMLENGISRRIVDKIMFENALHFFEENVR